MRRFRLIFATISAALCIAAVVMWIRSHTAGEIIGREGTDHTGFAATFRGVFSAGGQLALGKIDVERRVGLPEEKAFEPRVPLRWRWSWRREFLPFPLLGDAGNNTWPARLDFGSRRDAAGPDYRRHFRGLGLPHWLVVVVTGAMPLWLTTSRVVRGVRRTERTMAGRCAHCGYDLRAASGRCPECGHIVE